MTVFFAAGFSFVFRRYLEILPIFLLIDIVYGISEHRYHMVLGISVLASIIIFAGAELIKSRLVFYEHDKA